MRNTARTTAKALLIAAGTAGFVTLGSGFAAADTVGDVTGALGTGTLGQLPAVDTALPAPALPEVDPALPSAALPGVDVPEAASPEVDGVVGAARNQVDSVGVTVPRVNVPEVDTDGYLTAAQGTTVMVEFLSQQARGDVDAVAAEAGSVVDQTVSGVGTDLGGVDDLAVGTATGVTDGAVEDLDVPATDVVDTEVLPEAPAAGGVEDTVDGLTEADDLAELEVVDTETLPTDELPTDALDTDVTGADPVGDTTDALGTDLTDGLL